MMNWLFRCVQCDELCTKANQLKNKISAVDDFYHRQVEDMASEINRLKERVGVLENTPKPKKAQTPK